MSNVEAIKKAFPNMFRPLKWNHFPGETEYGYGEWFAHGTNKSYQIFDVRSKYPDDLPFYAKEISCQFETLEEAQEAVRTRDEQDILTRLDPDFLTTLEALQRENERLQAEIDRKSSMPGDHRYWEGRYRDEAAENERLRAVLKPFSRIADMEERAGPADSVMVNVARCREARTDLASAGEEHHAE